MTEPTSPCIVVGYDGSAAAECPVTVIPERVAARAGATTVSEAVAP